MTDLARPSVIGVDLGGTNLQAVVIDAEDRIVARRHDATDTAADASGPDGHAIADQIAAAVRNVAADAGMDPSRIPAVGVAAPGAVDAERGVVLTAPNLGWRHVALRDLLTDRLGAPVTVENDVNAAVWGEFAAGAGRDVRDLVGVWVGTGVGGGIVLGGELMRGDGFSTGEIGQTVIDIAGGAGARVLEHHAARIGMSRLVRAWAAEHPESPLVPAPGAGDERTSTEAVAAAFEAGDPLAVRVVDHAARCLGIAIANCVSLLSIRTVVIGGGITERLGEPWMERVEAAFRRDVFPDPVTAGEPYRLRTTALAGDAGTLGAGLLGRRRLVEPGR